MNSYLDTSTIVALATPPGSGALAIIRLSGPEALPLCAAIFQGRSGLAERNSGRFHGYLVDREDGGAAASFYLDEVVMHSYIAPRSYTGEDMVEINCHGSMLVVQRILALLLRKGARLAEPGEFSKRAFLNGKIDLMQAEAIADVIGSRSEKGLAYSLTQLHGDVSEKIGRVAGRIRESCALLELELDFSEDVEFVDRGYLAKLLLSSLQELGVILASYHYGRILREGAAVVLAGRVNVGKSTLMNRLLRHDRAIVSAMPGTTRDTLEEGLNLDGYFFRLTDTAGLRGDPDEIEKEGIARAYKAIAQSDILLLIFDATAALDAEDRLILALAEGRPAGSTLYLLNKIDCLQNSANAVPSLPVDSAEIVQISGKTGEGLETLQRRLVSCVERGVPGGEGLIITRARHYEALRRALHHLELAQQSLTDNQPGEFIALDLRLALAAVGEITGQVSSGDILNDIFNAFCIGK
jgi:tRNA modification GTPase